MLGVVLITLEALIVAAIAAALLYLRPRFGLTPFFMFIAVNLIYANVTAPVALHSFAGFSVTSGSAGLFGITLLALIWIFEIEGIKTASKYVYGMVLTSLATVVLFWLFLFKNRYILSPLSPFGHTELQRIFGMNIRVTLFSVLAFALDMFILVYLYSYVSLQYPELPQFLKALVPLTLVLYLDSLIFVTGSFWGQSFMVEVLKAHLATKTYIAILYSIVFVISQRFLPFSQGQRTVSQGQS